MHVYNVFLQKVVFQKKTLVETASSAIDILIPSNFWRFLYFKVDKDYEKIKRTGLMSLTPQVILPLIPKTFESV